MSKLIILITLLFLPLDSYAEKSDAFKDPIYLKVTVEPYFSVGEEETTLLKLRMVNEAEKIRGIKGYPLVGAAERCHFDPSDNNWQPRYSCYKVRGVFYGSFLYGNINLKKSDSDAKGYIINDIKRFYIDRTKLNYWREIGTNEWKNVGEAEIITEEDYLALKSGFKKRIKDFKDKQKKAKEKEQKNKKI